MKIVLYTHALWKKSLPVAYTANVLFLKLYRIKIGQSYFHFWFHLTEVLIFHHVAMHYEVYIKQKTANINYTTNKLKLATQTVFCYH